MVKKEDESPKMETKRMNSRDTSNDVKVEAQYTSSTNDSVPIKVEENDGTTSPVPIYQVREERTKGPDGVVIKMKDGEQVKMENIQPMKQQYVQVPTKDNLEKKINTKKWLQQHFNKAVHDRGDLQPKYDDSKINMWKPNPLSRSIQYQHPSSKLTKRRTNYYDDRDNN